MVMSCPSQHNHLKQDQYSGDRGMVVASPFHALSLISYNVSMGGVDCGDQLQRYYHCRVKSRKFYKYIFYFLLDVSITNTFILYRNFCSSPTFNTIKKFRLQLAKEPIGDCSTRRRAGPGGRVICPLPLQHFPIKIAKEATEPERKRRHYVCCSERNKRTETPWFCRKCNVFLCHTGAHSDCFLRWHKDRAPNQSLLEEGL